jgi:hypothetical protein
MIFLRHFKYPSDNWSNDNCIDEEAISSLPAILPRSGMGFYLIDLIQVRSTKNIFEIHFALFT